MNAVRTLARPRVLVALALVVLIAGAARGCWGHREAVAFTSSPVVRGPLEVTVLATGTIEAAHLVSVGTQATGEVKRLHVKLGDVLKKGDLIAEIDAKQQDNELQRATAALRGARADLAARQAVATQADLALKRLRELAAIATASRADLETAEANAATARANVIVAEAAITQARLARDAAGLAVGYARVVAPMDGTVVAIVTEQGQTVNSAQMSPTIIKLARLDTMTVRAQISEADVPRVRVGMPVRFTLLGDPATRYTAVLRAIEPGPTTIAGDASTTAGALGGGGASPVYYNGLFDVPNPDGALRISMTAQAVIVTHRVDDALLVPSVALDSVGRDGRATVRVVSDAQAGEATQERRVLVGLDNRTQAQVLEGLRIGERVVTSMATSASSVPGAASSPDSGPQP